MTEVLADLSQGPPSFEAVRAVHDRLGYRFAKRALDVCVSVLLLVALSPLLVAIAIAVTLDSRGSVLFRQTRLGSARHPDGTWHPTPFCIYKFRSMALDADETVHEGHIREFVNGALVESRKGFKLLRDARVTRVGRVLRRTSLDELPQLVNVLRGEMSLVGPRPVPVYEAVLYDSRYTRRFAARPGLTGLWQVRGRASRTFAEMMELDLEYVDSQSLVADLRILLQTVPAVFKGEGVA